jgi:purine nucleoside phosphorylase I, inosine and guanosine-specific
MLQKVKETVSFIESQTQNFKPEVGIILGTGLGGLSTEIQAEHVLPYKGIPNFPVSTVKGHNGKLIFGTLSERKIIAMQGRFHYYEGYSMDEVTFPVRVMKLLGIKLLIVSNASGAMNTDYHVGDVMLIKDHINMMPNPLIGKNYEEFGPRFPEMSQAYDKRILGMAQKIADELDIKVQQGVYVAVTGPTFETPMEYYHYKTIGGDCVGMSTAPEVIVARHMSLPVFAISVISDIGGKDLHIQVTHEEVLASASKAEPKMTAIIKELLKREII